MSMRVAVCCCLSGRCAIIDRNLLALFSPAGGSVNLVSEPPPLPPLTMATKAESVASVTSQCSFSSTIVHVGDKKPPESGGNPQHSHSLKPKVCHCNGETRGRCMFSVLFEWYLLLRFVFFLWGPKSLCRPVICSHTASYFSSLACLFFLQMNWPKSVFCITFEVKQKPRRRMIKLHIAGNLINAFCSPLDFSTSPVFFYCFTPKRSPVSAVFCFPFNFWAEHRRTCTAN